MKALLAMILVSVSFATGFTCSKNTPAPAEAPSQEQMAAPTDAPPAGDMGQPAEGQPADAGQGAPPAEGTGN